MPARLPLVLCLIASTWPTFSGAAPGLPAGEVRVYLFPDFSGPHQVFELEPGKSSLAVADIGSPWAGGIASIDVGGDVGVMLFEKINYRFRGSGYVNFVASVPDLSKAVPGAPNGYSSLIVYRRGLGNPMGLLAGNSGASEFRFFPLFQHHGCSYEDVRHLMPPPIDFVLLYSAQGHGEKLSARLFDGLSCQGKSVLLTGKIGLDHHRLADHGFTGPVVSMNLETTLPVAQMQDRLLLADPSQAAGAPPKPAMPAGKGNCSISGRATGTNASRAPLYRITLKGPNDPKRQHGSVHFDASGSFRFSALADGSYRLEVAADPGKASPPYPLPPPLPQAMTVHCSGAALSAIAFRFE